ncbi:hypothetical protein [Sporosarcina psychrophila]|uniref:NanoRNase/pAp phosphatase (C-di-AMP/oligoRNAs hydrolase) n=1 Tax=Sporosarcina psychrophila TaxID=1476 RepID=A0ABV2KBV5_SPOPS
MTLNDIDLDSFIRKSEEKTLNNAMKWNSENGLEKNKFVERSENYEKIKKVYTSESKNGDIVAIGSFEKRVYYNEDDYSFEDIYFISFSDENSGGFVTFINDDNSSFSFQVKLGKLHRIVQLKTSKVADKLDSWFD